MESKNKEDLLRLIIRESILKVYNKSKQLNEQDNDDFDDDSDLDELEFRKKYGNEFDIADKIVKDVGNIENDEDITSDEEKKEKREKERLEKEFSKQKGLDDDENDDRILSAYNPGIRDFRRDISKVIDNIRSYIEKFGKDATLLELSTITNPNSPTSLNALIELEKVLDGNTYHLNKLRQKYPNGFKNARGYINMFSIKDNSPELYSSIKLIIEKIKRSDKSNRDKNRLNVMLGLDNIMGYNFHNRHTKDIILAYNNTYSLTCRLFDEISKAAGFKYYEPIPYGDEGNKIVPSKLNRKSSLIDKLEDEPDDEYLDKKILGRDLPRQ